MRADAELAWSLEQGGGWQIFAGQNLATSMYLSGESRQAEQLLMELLDQSDEPEERAWIMAWAGLISVDRADWDRAMDLDRRIGESASNLTTPVLLLHARLLARCKDPGLNDYIEVALTAIGTSFNISLLGKLLLDVNLAVACLEADDEAGAERWLADADRILATYPDAGVLRGRADRTRAALAGRRLAEPLTAAERRVLDLLPTQLTGPQIAARLFLATNTVKSHLKHLYTKLGVTSRTAAVERGRELGLLSPRGGA